MFDWVLNMPLNFEKSYYTIGKSGRMQNEEVISLQNQIKKKKMQETLLLETLFQKILDSYME